MIAAITLFIIVFLTMLVNRIATIALTHTGLSTEVARFQARSALTGSGFTTSESEKVVTHPVRRKIILMLMLAGNAGIVTVMASLILTFVIPDTSQHLLFSVIILVVGVAFLWWAAQSDVIDRRLSKIIDQWLKRYTDLDVKDYASILRLWNEYKISELKVGFNDWIANKALKDVELWSEGVLVLGIQREGTYIGTPNGETVIKPGDTLTLYGKDALFESLDRRKKGRQGDKEHEQQMAKQAEEEEHEEAEKEFSKQ